VYEVFTPTSQAKLNYVPRPAVNDHLVSALATPGKQVIVYGESGSGKSTLLQKKLEETYEHHITTRCHASATFEQIIADAFDRLNVYFESQLQSGSGRTLSGGISTEIRGLKAQFESARSTSSSTTSSRIVPP
jgi:excinuclease UvrABC ATPase subunit